MADATPEIYNWVRVNVAGDGNCFYRSLYEAARLHWMPAVLDDLLRCLGLTRMQIEAPATVTAPPATGTRRIRRLGGAKTRDASIKTAKASGDRTFYKAAEDRFCRLARSALAAKVRDASGALLDTLGADSPYNALLGLKTQLFQLQFGDPTNILQGLYQDIQSELTSNGPTEPVSPEFIETMMLDLYGEYFHSSTPPATLQRLKLQAKHAYELATGNTDYVENAGFIQPENHLRDDLTLGDFPKSFHSSLAETWGVFLESMSSGFQRVFRDFTKFPKSQAEFATKYSTILEKYGEFTTDIDIHVVNAVVAQCNLRVHITSNTAPKRVETPAPLLPIYVMLDAEGEHYNFLLVPSKYEEAPSEYDLYGGYTPEPQFYSDDELFTADSVRIHGDSEPEVRVKPTEEDEEEEEEENNLARLLANSSNNNMRTAIKASLRTAGLRGGSSKKRRVTQKKRRA